MEDIKNNFNQFAERVRDSYVIVNNKGQWQELKGFRKFISRIFLRDDARLNKIATIFAAEMDKLAQSKISTKAEHQQADTLKSYNSCLKASEILQESLLAKKPAMVNSKEIKAIRAKYFSIQYRIGSDNGGLSKSEEPNPQLFDQLKVLATDWKSRMPFFNADSKNLSERDLNKLAEFCRYEEYAKFVMDNDPVQREELFKWCLRDGNNVDVFIEFPSIRRKIANSALSARVGAMGEHVFGLRTDTQTGLKDVTMAFVNDQGNTLHVSLLDENGEVEFNENFKVTIGQVFKIFADKRKDIIGNLEMFEKGVHNWNIANGSRFNGSVDVKIDMEKRNWWEQIPTYKTYSLSEARQIYGDHMNGVNWIACAKSTFESESYDLSGTHGFMEVVIPVRNDDGKMEYRVYPFGKFPVNFPTSTLATIIFLMRTVKPQYHLLDQNVYYSHRQTTEYQIQLKPSQGKDLMRILKRDINGEEGYHNKFSLKKYNCCEWVQKTLNEVFKGEYKLPNLYTIPLTQTDPRNALRPIIKAFNRMKGGVICHPFKLAEIASEQIKEKMAEISQRQVPNFPWYQYSLTKV